MPKLSPIQWLIVAAIQFFFGFAVFALTRDYYQRHPPAGAQVTAAGPHAGAARPAARVPPEVGGGTQIPDSVIQKDPVLLVQMADEQLAARQFPEAVQFYRQALQLKPDEAEIQNALGLALHYNGDTHQATQVLRQGTEKAPGFQRIWLTLGFVQLQTDAAGARAALEKAMELGRDNEIGQEAARMLGRLETPR